MSILIPSTKAEKTTNDVIDWLSQYRSIFIRITERDNYALSVQNGKIKIGNFSEENIHAVWIRKGQLHFEIDEAIKRLPKIETYLQHEFAVFSDYLIKKLERKPHIGNYFQRLPNKLWHLEKAHEAGLLVPETLITTQKYDVVEFIKKHVLVINKSIKDSFTGNFGDFYYYNHTERITAETIETLDETFFSTLLQAEIPKAYELRVVFVHETIWAGAIISQNDSRTSLDWRNYNRKKPNRIVPYKLPTEVEDKVRVFSQLANLNTGAIDMIVSKNNEYVFLECNPNGQISMVSEKCNYPIEKHIANFLANA